MGSTKGSERIHFLIHVILTPWTLFQKFFYNKKSYEFLFVVSFIIECGDVHFCSVRHKDSSFSEPFVSGEEYWVEHAFVKQEVSHPLRDNDIDLIDWKGDFLDKTIDDGNFVTQSIFFDNISTVNVDVGFFDSVDVFGSTFSWINEGNYQQRYWEHQFHFQYPRQSYPWRDEGCPWWHPCRLWFWLCLWAFPREWRNASSCQSSNQDLWHSQHRVPILSFGCVVSFLTPFWYYFSLMAWEQKWLLCSCFY